MKYTALIIALFILSPFVSKAQSLDPSGASRLYKPFKVDVGLNLTFPTESELTTGGGFYVEPRYGINDQINIGLQLGSNILGEGESLFNHQEATYRAQAISNLSLTGEYLFGKENTRPFVGVMVGMYRRSDYEIVDSDDGTIFNQVGNEVNFGVAPRIGLIAGKFRMNFTYHITGENISDFFSIGLGIQFGGGKIKNEPKKSYSTWE
ncbi:hypothetical protein [Echinicola rosea]|uniref:Outer membrane protein beta-barrel domain-containing protein n=1 Tax=Echinicola rosea TaxID=1807691 RepID=A0ABQ1VDK8_9BACT|nr:hypothetical protein [Echinicola rosea]GGF51154.1 hypothetical protein GCM10011339_44640 [Echinicola rosea]